MIEDKLNALELFGENEYLHKEIERLNNIINELEKWLIIQHDIYKNVDKKENTRLSCQYLKVKDKLQELKGSDKE